MIQLALTGEAKMPYGKRKVKRYGAKDVGRKGHHYIRIAVLTGKGRRGGTTIKIGKLKKYKKRR
jgi:hypothetical protein